MEDRVLFSSRTVALGRFRCDPGDALWDVINRISDGPLVAFPRTPVRIEHEGRPARVRTQNDAVCYNANQAYRRQLVEPHGDHCYWIHVAPAVLRELLAATDPQARDRDDAGLFRTDHVATDADTFLRQRLLFEGGLAGGDVLAIEETALAVVERLARGAADAAGSARSRESAIPARSRTTAAHRTLAQSTTEFLSIHFREPLSLSTIAAAIGVSEFHLCRVFRAQFGVSIHAFTNRLRLRWALDRVLDGGQSLTQAGLVAGFCSSAHFSDAFRREFGVPPSRIRADAVGWSA